MRKLFKIIGLVAGGFVGLLAVSAGGIYVASEARINKTYVVQPQTIDVPTDAAAIAEGQRQFTVRGCVDCHGADLGGKTFADDPMVGYLAASNLTRGKGGVADDYTDVDWVRAIWHGVGPDGKPLLVMPSNEFRGMTATDLGNLIAYIKSVPAVDRERQPARIGLLFRGLFVGGQIPLVAAERIDHTAPVVSVKPAISVEYGKALAMSCTGCHQANFAGGPLPGRPADSVPAANLTPAGRLSAWTEADFIRTIRTGVRPDGRPIDNADMPWQAFAQFKDDELKAIWLYLQSLPPVTPVTPESGAN